MSPRALWLPYELPNVVAAQRFYTDRLGLSTVDEWRTETEHGVVLHAGEAFIELVAPGNSPRSPLTSRPPLASHPPLAFQLADKRAVDQSFTDWQPASNDVIAGPHTYPRGHYGFEVRGPANTTIMVWSEK